jgi:RNA polymerase sigma-70 factor (ECF subfamily)
MQEVLSYSLLVLMEKLNAKERAVFILSESFDYPHSEIAEVLGITEENSRKLLSRAKQALFKPVAKHPTQRDREVLQQLVEAIKERDINTLHQLVTADIQYYGDGGGKIPLAAKYMTGADNVIALQILGYHKFLTKARLQFVTVNHQPAMVSYVGKYLTACQIFTLHPQTGKVMEINLMLDPKKLKTLSKSINSNT